MALQTFTVTSGEYDADQDHDDGAFDRTSTVVTPQYAVSAGTRRHAGFVFTNVTIDKDTTIIKAEFKATVTDAVSNDINCTWYGELQDDAASYIDVAGVPHRVRTWPTTATVAWTAPNVGGVGDRVTSPDLKTIIQEIVDQAGWVNGNALGIIMHSDAVDGGICNLATYEHATYDTPSLEITTAGGGAPGVGGGGPSLPNIGSIPTIPSIAHTSPFGGGPAGAAPGGGGGGGRGGGGGSGSKGKGRGGGTGGGRR
jgi:hypothetical protein